MKIKDGKVYTMPKLCTCGGNLEKDWFVYFNHHNLNGTYKQFRYKLGINYLKTKKERIQEGNAIIEALLGNLRNGWNPLTNVIDREEQIANRDKLVIDCFDEMLKIKSAYITKRSYKTYYDQANLFKKWLKLKKIDYLYVQNVTNKHIRGYCDWLLSEKRYTGKTHNSHLTTIRTFFNDFVSRKYIDANPAAGIKAVREETGKNTTYSEEEERAFDKIKDKYPDFYFATRFVRYCFLRRSELSMVQIKHINWKSKTIVIPSEIAKNRNQDSVTIPKSLEKLIIQRGVLNLDPETYIFGKNFKPSLVKLNRVDDFSDQQREINRDIKIKPECTFYSWKHTGAVELYLRTKDVYVVMRQCRHSDIKMTMKYLRSLGCMVNEQVREW